MVRHVSAVLMHHNLCKQQRLTYIYTNGDSILSMDTRRRQSIGCQCWRQQRPIPPGCQMSKAIFYSNTLSISPWLCSLFKATMLNTVFKHGLLIVVLCRSGQGKCLPCRSLGFESRRRLFYTFESKFFFFSFFLYN